MHLKIQDVILEFCTYVWVMNRETVNSTAAEIFIILKLSYDKSKLLTIFFKICSSRSLACLWNYKNFFGLTVSVHFTKHILTCFFILFQFPLSLISLIWKFVLVRMSALGVIISYPIFLSLNLHENMIMMWSLIIY